MFEATSKLGKVVDKEENPEVPNKIEIGLFLFERDKEVTNRIEYFSKDAPGANILIMEDEKKILVVMNTMGYIGNMDKKTLTTFFESEFSLTKNYLIHRGIESAKKFQQLHKNYLGGDFTVLQILEKSASLFRDKMVVLVNRSDIKKVWKEFNIDTTI